MNTRNLDGTASAPAGAGDVAAIFQAGDTEAAILNLVDLFGEDQEKQLGAYAEKLAALAHPVLLGMLCEHWQSNVSIAPVINLLERIDPRFTLRALVAQRVCRGNPGLAAKLLPFYRIASGLVDA